MRHLTQPHIIEQCFVLVLSSVNILVKPECMLLFFKNKPTTKKKKNMFKLRGHL